MRKILISGYYGFDNFGDDAILYAIVSELKKKLKVPEIVVLSNNPAKIEKNYEVDSIHRFNYKDIIGEMKASDVFISGGGSLLQDATSFKSLLYYLWLINLATSFRKKTIIFAQGIGPISTIFARFLTRRVLLKANLISVRDRESRDFLNKMRLDSVLSTDAVWCLKDSKLNPKKSSLLKPDKVNVGIQLRKWKTLTDKNLEAIADVISKKFSDEKYCINLISLQDSHDLEITQKLKSILFKKDLNSQIRIYSNLSVEQNIELLGHLDYLIAMRFHACLVAINYNIPTIALSYDPKVKNLALESKIPFLNIDSLHNHKKDFAGKIDELILNNEEIRENLREFADRKYYVCKENFNLLIKTIMQE